MLIAVLFCSLFFFFFLEDQLGVWVGGGGLLAFLHCVLCARPGLGWVPYPLFTLSHFSDTPPPPPHTPTLPFLPTEHPQPPPLPILLLQPCHCQQHPCALHKTPHPLPQQFLIYGPVGLAPVTQMHPVALGIWYQKQTGEGVWVCGVGEFESHSITQMKACFNSPENILWSFLMMIK